jgi:hypothetical protein
LWYLVTYVCGGCPAAVIKVPVCQSPECMSGAPVPIPVVLMLVRPQSTLPDRPGQSFIGAQFSWLPVLLQSHSFRYKDIGPLLQEMEQISTDPICCACTCSLHVALCTVPYDHGTLCVSKNCVVFQSMIVEQYGSRWQPQVSRPAG